MFKLLFFKLLLITFIIGSCELNDPVIKEDNTEVISDTLSFIKERYWSINDTVNIKYRSLFSEDSVINFNGWRYTGIDLKGDTVICFYPVKHDRWVLKFEILKLNKDSLVFAELTPRWPRFPHLDTFTLLNHTFMDNTRELKEIQLGFDPNFGDLVKMKVSKDGLAKYTFNFSGSTYIGYRLRDEQWNHINELVKRIDFENVKKNFQRGHEHGYKAEIIFKFKNRDEEKVNTMILNSKLSELLNFLVDDLSLDNPQALDTIEFDLKTRHRNYLPIPIEPPPEDY